MIVTNAEAFAIGRRTTDAAIGACEALMTLVPVQAEARRRSDDGILVEQAVTLSLPHGIHARPAARIGEAARGFDDHAFALEMLETEDVLLVPGSSFNVPYRNHFRVTLLPEAPVLREVFARIDRVLARRADAGSARASAVA